MARHMDVTTDGHPHETVHVPVGQASSGNEVVESLLVEPVGEGIYRLLRSPGLADGLAAGDLFRLLPGEEAGFEILKRGGNLAVQIYHDGEQTPALLAAVAALESLGGTRDDRGGKATVVSVPVSVGFPVIERVMTRFLEVQPNSEWYFGNVYDPQDGVTPLAWWEEE